MVDTNRIDGRLMALPWYVDTRLQFYRKDLFERRRLCRAARCDGTNGSAALHAVKRAQGGEGFAILLPINEYEHLTQMALSAGATFLNADGTRGAFPRPSFARRWPSTSRSTTRGSRRSPARRRFRNVWNEFARGYFAVYPSGPWTIGDMKSRLARRPPVELGDRALPRPRRPRALDPRRVEPGRLFERARSRRGVGAGRRG